MKSLSMLDVSSIVSDLAEATGSPAQYSNETSAWEQVS